MTDRSPGLTLVRRAEPETLAQDLAAHVAALLSDALDRRGQALLLVSGGRSPIALFERLGSEDLDWSRVTVSLVDERCVPLTHPDSNAGLVRRHLLQGSAAAARFIGLAPDDLETDADPRAPAAAAEQALAPCWPADVAVLGMGEDGHTASWFAGAPEFEAVTDPDGPHRYLGLRPPVAPHPRITVTLAGMLACRHRIVQLSGQNKLTLFEQIRRDPWSWPIGRLLAQGDLEAWVSAD